jgi:hypothetical protein
MEETEKMSGTETIRWLAAFSLVLVCIVFGISSYDEWVEGDAKYLKDGVLAVLLLGVALLNVWELRRRWRQKPPE